MGLIRDVFRRMGARQRVSIGLIVLLVAVIGVARLASHSHHDPLVSTGGPATLVSPAPGDSLGEGPATLPSAAPSEPLLHSPVPPTGSPGLTPPQTVAKSFATAWLHHTGVDPATWLKDVTAYTTADVAAQLKETDPDNVPASRITKALTVVDDTPTDCDVQVPTDTGTLTLTMSLTEAKWLVSDIDWEQS
jgi:hypothetical protein